MRDVGEPQDENVNEPYNELDDPLAFLIRLFGERAGLYSLNNLQQRQQFGFWLRWLREHTLLEHVQPNKSKSNALTQLSLIPGSEGKVRHVSRAVFLGGYKRAFESLTGIGSPHDETHVKRLEAGEVPLTPLIPCCASFALRTGPFEAAILFEAAGCGGWDTLSTQRDEEENMNGANFIRFISDAATGKLSLRDIDTILKAMRDMLDDDSRNREP